MSDIELTYREFYLYIVIGGAVIGALLGIVPLMLGKRRGKSRIGWYGLIASAIAGGLAGPVLSLIVVAIFAVVLLRDTATDSKNDNNSASE
ncbi:MAG TPA: hypothetical protein VNA22_01520 [Pyrinomonadaceae bacterium]|nr:hypothetical protein [Pyrinomonadaceae bacterium]